MESKSIDLQKLIKEMTLEEKIGQLNQLQGRMLLTGDYNDESQFIKMISEGKVGSILNVHGIELLTSLQKAAVERSHLGIPLIFAMDVIHGLRTIFPIPLGETCSFDMDLLERTSAAVAREASASGILWTFAPMVDICRDPRWGRITEGAGEDTYLGCCAAAASTKGFQSNSLSNDGSVLACVKHFAAYGAPVAGLDYNSVDMSERELRDVYLPPFKAAIDAGVGSIMPAFHDLNGIPCHSDANLQDNILRGEFNFKGISVSDAGRVKQLITHGVSENETDAALLGMKAKIDMDMYSSFYTKHLPDLLATGKITMDEIDAAVMRILEAKMALNLFDDPYGTLNKEKEKNFILCDKHINLAREAGRKSIVLLKNDNHLLPLSKDIRNLALIGPLGDNKVEPLGSWSALGQKDDVITLLEGIQNALPNTEIMYSKGCEIDGDDESIFEEAIETAKKADIIIAAMGESKAMSGEAHNRAYLNLPGKQENLLKELARLGKPIVLILMNGRPLVIPWAAQNIPAILEAWFPRVQAGNAIADVLFSDYNPSGKLCTSFPVCEGQIPIYYGYRETGHPRQNERYGCRYMDVQIEPLYPFGFGLSYTTFEYSNLALDKEIMQFNESINIDVTLKNTGSCAGEECKISFSLTSDDLAFWNIDMAYKAEPGKFKVFVGGSSQDCLEAEFELA